MGPNLWSVIPVAGVGSRLRPHTHTRPKPLLPVAGQPILGHILDPLLAVGIRRVVLVTGPMGEQIVEYVRGYGRRVGGPEAVTSSHRDYKMAIVTEDLVDKELKALFKISEGTLDAILGD